VSFLRELICRRTKRKAPVDDTRHLIAEAEQVKAQLSRLSRELADYVADLRALTNTLAVQHEGNPPPHGRAQAQGRPT
jgi:hypothetical protein